METKSKNEEIAERIREETAINAEEIQALLGQLIELVPPNRLVQAEWLRDRLEKRLFYQNYLYNCHGALAGYEGDPETDIVLDYDDYDEYVRAVTVAIMLL